MKRCLLFILLCFLSIFSTTHAREYTFTANTVTLGVQTQPNGATVLFTLKGSTATQGNLTVWKTKERSGTYSGKLPFEQLVSLTQTAPTKTVQVTGLEPDTTYYLSYAGMHEIQTEKANVCAVADSDPMRGFTRLGITYIDKNVVLSGKIDPVLHPCFKNFKITLEVSKDEFSTDLAKTPGDAKFFEARMSQTGAIGIADDGSYFFTIPALQLQPSTTYYYRLKITDLARGGKTGISIGSFPSEKGYTPVGSTQSSFEKHSYRLLAPFPGLSVVMDPALCAEQKNAGKLAPNAICDVNGLINFLLRILIGICAVLLVFRIMINGYNYIVSDIPFLKSKAKTNVLDGALGLGLALSAYVILNTINPKLVENTVQIDSVGVGILEPEEDSEPITDQRNISISKGTVAACKAGIVRIDTKGGAFYACKTIAPRVKAMIDLAWSQNIKISGGGFRTREQQIALRAKHCGSGNVYTHGARCTPPTAYPGRSRHESGLAFDLTCEGSTIRDRGNKCFTWLQRNAKNFGLINFAKEPWHWSVDGK